MSAIAAIHVGLKQLGIEQDDARDLYERQTGKRSLRDMRPRELEAVVGELRRLGFKPSSKGAARRVEGRYAKKLQAMWIALWNLGLTADRTDRALVSFVQRQTKVDHTRFLHDPADAAKVIEALKGWMAREAGVEWRGKSGLMATDGGKIAWAQFRLLVPGATLIGNLSMFAAEVAQILNTSPAGALDELSAADWRAVMNAFGARIRATRSAA